MRFAYYNEHDRDMANWLRQLIRDGLITDGDVDERSIEDVTPADIAGYRECHWFAGIGGWPLALQFAGFDGPVWTGSCPCQPFSKAGARRGEDDPRHLWPAWRWLIDQSRPVTIFGEQVASPDGREWYARVRSDLDLLGYATGAADLCAAGVGAPHIRQRIFWVADTDPDRIGQHARSSGVGDAGAIGSQGLIPSRAAPWTAERARAAGRMDHANGGGREIIGQPEHAEQQSALGLQSDGSGASGFWDRAEWIECEGGKARRVEPGISPLVDGFPERVALVRGYGNAIVPQLGAAFIRAHM